MNVSLDQAIEIYAKALNQRVGPPAPRMARAEAERCATIGDDDGCKVWLRVALTAESLASEEAPRAAAGWN